MGKVRSRILAMLMAMIASQSKTVSGFLCIQIWSFCSFIHILLT